MKTIYVVVGVDRTKRPLDKAAVTAYDSLEKASEFLEGTASYYANQEGFSATMYVDDKDMVENVVVEYNSKPYVSYWIYKTKLY